MKVYQSSRGPWLPDCDPSNDMFNVCRCGGRSSLGVTKGRRCESFPIFSWTLVTGL